MTVRFNELQSIVELQDDDLIAAHDVSEGVTGSATVEQLKSKLITKEFIQDSTPDIIQSLNDYPTLGADAYKLNASRLRLSEDDKSFYYGEYYLNWNNTTNKPIIPLDFSQLENSKTDGYIKLVGNRIAVQEQIRQVDPVTGAPSVDTAVDPTTGTIFLSTDNLPQGQNNLYYDDERVDQRVIELFPEEFNKLSPRFDKAFSVDSLTETYGEFINGTQESDEIFVADPLGIIVNSYRVGDVLRVYGAGQATNTTLDNAPSAENFIVTPSGFLYTDSPLDEAPAEARASTKVTFEYRIATFSFITGEISPAISAPNLSKTIYISEDIASEFGEGSDVSVFDLFNAETFIDINFSSNIASDQGLLIYRRVDSADDFRLVYVLGPKEKERGSFIDYYNFDNGVWTEKREYDNSFLVNGEQRETDNLNTTVEQDGLMHFPINPPSVSQRGWVDTEVVEVQRNARVQGTAGFIIRLINNVTFNTVGSAQKKCWISHNDTLLINNAIAQAGAGAVKSLNLNAKQYVVDVISLPDEFGLVGVPYISKLKKMPWSGYGTQNGSINNMIRAKSTSGKSISISGVDIDGTSNLQFLMSEPADNPRNNYMVDLGVGSRGCLFDKVRIDRPVAGGIWARVPSDLKITGSEITNSGNSDRYQYSPALIDQGENTVITANRFNNFTQYIDISVTNQGIISGNIIANVGSGIFVYGSKFLITNPNTLVGPAGEFLPSPDILNSEFDAVNLELQDAFIAGSVVGGNGQFKGPALTYQENGEVYDLKNGIVANIEFVALMIRKDEDGSESTWTFGSETIPHPEDVNKINPDITFNISIDQETELGQFGFIIPADDVRKIKAAYQGGPVDGIYSYARLRDQLKAADVDINHVGLAWGAVFTGAVAVGNIGNVMTWDADQELEKPVDGQGVEIVTQSGDTDLYVIQVSIPTRDRAKFTVGGQIKFDTDHNPTINGSPPEYGTIEDVTQLPNGDWRLAIRYTGATSILSGVPGNGTLNIIDSFTLAGGRIL